MSDCTVQAPNSLILVGDAAGALPYSIGGLVAASESMVAIGTLMEHDGPTMIRLLDQNSLESVPEFLVWEGTLQLSNGVLAVTSVLKEVYLESRRGKKAVRVQIYVNDTTEPDHIAILIAS